MSKEVFQEEQHIVEFDKETNKVKNLKISAKIPPNTD